MDMVVTMARWIVMLTILQHVVYRIHLRVEYMIIYWMGGPVGTYVHCCDGGVE